MLPSYCFSWQWRVATHKSPVCYASGRRLETSAGTSHSSLVLALEKPRWLPQAARSSPFSPGVRVGDPRPQRGSHALLVMKAHTQKYTYTQEKGELLQCVHNPCSMDSVRHSDIPRRLTRETRPEVTAPTSMHLSTARTSLTCIHRGVG